MYFCSSLLSSRMKLATSFWLFSCALKLTAKKFRFFFYPNNFNLKKPIYLLTHTSTHTKIHFLHIVRQFLEQACSIDTYKPYTNSNCITIDFEKNRISNVISFNFQYLSDLKLILIGYIFYFVLIQYKRWVWI